MSSNDIIYNTNGTINNNNNINDGDIGDDVDVASLEITTNAVSMVGGGICQ